MNRRKHISLKAQLHAALYQLGLDPANVHLDHSPPLALREWDEKAQDTIPPASDPKHLVWMATEAHREKTSGRKNVTAAGSDIHAIAKVKRLNGEKPRKPKGKPLPGTKASGWKRPMRGKASKRMKV